MMKTLGSTMWTFVWVLVIVVAVGGGTVYPGQEALLSYNPARGEFPVQSLFGQGFFGYIDENGNSRIVSLEANPLLGVRIGTNGEPLVEAGRTVDLEKDEKKDTSPNPKDRLKPIKEFDENPFLDAVVENVVLDGVKDSKSGALIALPSMIPGQKGPATMYLPPSMPVEGSKNSLPTAVTIPGQEKPLIMYLPPTSEANSQGDLVPSSPQQQGPAIMYLPPSASSDKSKDSLPSLPVPAIIAPGQQPQVPVATKSSLPSLPVPAIIAPGQQSQIPAATKSSLPSLPVPAIVAPGQQSQIPATILPKQGTPVEVVLSPVNPFLPSTLGLVLLDPSSAIQGRQIFLTPPSTPDIVFPNSPLLSGLGGVLPNPQPPVQQSLPEHPPSESFPTPPPNAQSILPDFPTTGQSATSGVFPNPSAPVQSSQPQLPGSGVPNQKPPALVGSAEFSNTPSPILGAGNPFLPIGGVPPTRPAPTVFPNPPAPAPAPTVFPNPKPPTGGNPFLSPNSIRDKPLSQPTTTAKPEFKPNENNPFLPRAEFDPDIRSISLDSNSSPTPEGDKIPEQVKDTAEVEQAKREHFLAHEKALARLAMAEQQDANEQVDESSMSPMSSGTYSPLVYLPPVDVASPQPVTSGPSTTVAH